MGYRQDTEITHQLPAFRRMLAFIMPDRTQSVVWFTQTLDLTKTEAWIAEKRKTSGRNITFLHLFLAGAGRMLHAHPYLNRYVCGYRYWQRDGVTISVSAKKKKQQGSKTVLLKLPLMADDTVETVHDRLAELLGEGRQDKEIHQEKEMSLFLRLPGFLLERLIPWVHTLDRLHWLPGAFVDPDPLYTSLMVANLGSVGLDAAYHHLFEYGNCPFFAVIGRAQDGVVVEDGQVKVRKQVDIKYTFDDRVEDGLSCALALTGLRELLEDPDKFTNGVFDWHGKPPDKV